MGHHLKLLDAIDDNGRVTRTESFRDFRIEESLRMLDNHFHSFAQHVDVGFDQSVFLQEILDAHEMFAVVFRQEAHLEFFHRVQDVQHFLEDQEILATTVCIDSRLDSNLEVLLQLQRQFQTHTPGPQQFQKIVPQAEDIIFASIDAINVVIIFGFQFQSNGHHSLNTFFVSQDVRFDGFVLLGSSFHSSQIETKVVLIFI